MAFVPASSPGSVFTPTSTLASAFVCPTTVTSAPAQSEKQHARIVRPRKLVVVAVLDTPASNTYLQRHAEVVLRDFLTRRAVDTVMYYMHELGDRPSHQWLSGFHSYAKHVKQRTFKNGEHFINSMFSSPPEEGSVKIGHPSGRFSRTVHFTIEPAHIAQRIVDVRVQLSKEWSKDLRCVDAENLELQRLAFERMMVTSEKELNSKKNLIFDSDPFANDQTPLRFKNYVGLKTLITQHAVARLLPYMRDRGSNHEYMYLLQFVNSHGVIEDGDQFLRSLMAKPAESRTNPEFTVIPKSIASQVMELRSAIAAEWITVMDFVPVEQELNTRGKLERSVQASLDLPDDTENGEMSAEGM